MNTSEIITGARRSGWIAALLPLLVGLLPFLVLHLETAELARISHEKAVQSWLGTAVPLGGRFNERARPQFWLEEGLRRARSGQGPMGATAENGAWLSRATGKLRRWGLTDLQVWAASGNPFAATDQFTLLDGANLRGDFRVFFRGLLKELAIEGSGTARHISGETWTSRLKATFGDGVPTELFSRAWRGQAFFVTFQRRFGLAVWDTLPDRDGKISGAVFFFWPLGHDFARRGVELALRHWHMISPSHRFIPAAIDLPAPGTRRKRRLLLPAALSSDSCARSEMHALGRSLKANPAHPGSFRLSDAETALPVGKIDLHTLDKPSTTGARWLLPLPLPPLSGLAGMIVSPAPDIPDSFTGMLARHGLHMYAIIILIYICALVVGMPVPALTVRTELLLWLFALAAVPAALLMASQERLTADQAFNRREELRAILKRHLERIDSGSSSVTQMFAQECRDILRSVALAQAIEKAETDEAAGTRLLDSIESRCASSGMELSGIFIYGHGGFRLTRVSQTVNPDTADRLCWYHEVLAGETLTRIAPQLAKEATTRPQKKSSAAEMSRLDILARNDNFLGPPDTAYTYRLGNKHTLRYYDLVYQHGGARYLVFILWTQDRVYKTYLSTTLKRIRTESPELGLCAFQPAASRLEMVSAAATPGQIGELSAAIRNLPESASGLSESVLYAGKAMPGYIFGATTPLAPLNSALAQDSHRSLVIFFFMVFLLFGGGLLLSRWLADPVRKMAMALRRVANDDLGAQVAIRRSDELGDAAGILDTMIGWLRERRAMSRFVSSQVMDVISKGGMADQSQTGRIHAALLVSDIRSFTTMSESHAAPMIFSMLNAHLAAMTSIIQKHGGSIDRFIGDAIQAVFLPGPGATPAKRAVLAGYEMMEEHHRLQQQRSSRGEFTYGIGVGIDQGEVVTGILGDPQVRLDFTVLGESLKHASDLEARSKGGSHTLVIASDAVVTSAGSGFQFIRLPEMKDDHEEPAWELVSIHESGATEADVVPSACRAPLSEARNASVETSVGPQDTHRRDFTSRWVAIAVFLWISPLLLLFMTSRDLDISSKAAATARVRIQLKQDMQLAEQMSDPIALAQLLIQQCITPIMSRDCNTRQNIVMIQNRMRLLRNLIPGIRCVFTSSGNQINSPPRIMTEGKPHIFTAEEWGDVYQLFRGNFQNYTYPTFPGHDAKWMRKRLSQTNLWGATREGFGKFLKIPVNRRDVLFTWFPLYGSDPSGACPEGAASIDASFGRTTLFSPRIKGALFLTVTPEKIGTGSGIINIIRYLSRRGCVTALIPMHHDASADSFMHPLFRHDAVLSSSLSNTTSPEQGWEIQEGCVTLDRPYRIIAARRVIPVRQPPGIHLTHHWLATAIWLFSGLLACKFGRDVMLNRRLPRLHIQLTAAFVFVLLPMLFMAFLALERTAEEHALRVFTDNLSVLADTLDKTDRHREYIQTWAVAVTDRLLHRKALFTQLIREEQQKSPSQDTTHSPVIARELIRFARWGLVCTNPMITGLDGFFLGYFGEKNVSNITFLTDMMRFSSNRVLSSLASASGTRSKKAGDIGKDLLVGTGLEELQQLLLSATPADALCQFLTAPNDISNIDLFNMADTFLRVSINENGSPRWIFQGGFLPHSFDTQALLSSRRSSEGILPIRIGFSNRLEPMLLYISPYYIFSTQDSWSIKVRNRADAISPLLMPLSTISLNTGSSPAIRIGKGDGEKMLMSATPARMADKLLFAELSTGKLRSASEAALNHKRLILFAILLFSILLARYVATRFLNPLTSLSAAAKRMMSKDFSIRLPRERGVEFGDVATSFNLMAQGVEEGRLLSRFVSESVRSAARDTSREEAARRGEQTEATILFAGLGNFKSVLSGTDPALLVPRLNRYLETMSQAIRNNGGDIDKFIGEKILAVFFPERLGGLSRSADAALRAAIDMQKRMAHLRDDLNLPLGIGIVAGPVLAGIMGTPDVRLEYTVIGDTVNLASRLGDIAIRLDPHGTILGSPDGAEGGIVVEARLGNLLLTESDGLRKLLLPLDLPAIKGKTRSVRACHIARASGQYYN